uniref:Uncharacterized protein n=1 Tax=Rhizophora mucronata TaxID=61149 RepID=A0A2P2P4T5_RHIMU
MIAIFLGSIIYLKCCALGTPPLVLQKNI